MKVQYLRDSKGEIVATFELTPGANVSVRPEIANDQRLEEVETPEDYTSDVDLFYQSYQKLQKIQGSRGSKKIQQLKDSKGEIVATFESTPGATVSVRPEITNDQIIEEVEKEED